LILTLDSGSVELTVHTLVPRDDNGCRDARERHACYRDLKRSRFLKDLLTKGSIPILLGTGGVGKTTIAAALALAGASANLNTAVITVDPSERLRDALGLAHLGGEPTRIGARQLAAAGLDAHLQLSAMMLDVSGEWDAIIKRFVTDPATREKIFDIRSTKASPPNSPAPRPSPRSSAFTIFIRPVPSNSKSWTLRPHRIRLSSCKTPAKMIRLLDSRTARWLFTPSLSAGRIAMKVASNAARFVVRELERFAGGNVLSTITRLFRRDGREHGRDYRPPPED